MPLSLYLRGGIWHFRGSVAGRRLRGSTRIQEQNRQTAERYIVELERQEWKSRFDGPASVLTFAQAAILYRKAEKPPRFLDRVEDHWRDTPVKNITAGAVRQAAIETMPKAGPATRNRGFIVPTQAIINHAAAMELCPPLRMKRFAVPKRERKYATWEWVDEFMEHARPNLGALACFMFLTGARITEAIRLRWEDVDLTAGTALIRQTKIATERVAHMPPVLVAAIANIRGAPNPYNSKPSNDRVFGYMSRSTARVMWDAVLKRSKMRKLSFHACRHGFATAALRAGIDPVTVAKLGGWKSTDLVFKTYGHAMEEKTLTDRLVGAPRAQKSDKLLARKA